MSRDGKKTNGRLALRPPHLVLAGIAIIVIVVGIVEQRPTLKDDFDSARDAEFADTWDQRLHLSYWEKWGSFEREACQAMVDAFNRSQDEIFVHYINTSQVDRKSMLAIMGHDPPDVVGLWANNVPSFAAANALLDLEEFMASTGLDKERYIPNYLNLGTYNDRVYALPTTPSSVGLYYNKEHFREEADALRAAGLDPNRAPRNTEELDRYADVLNTFDENGRPIRMGFLPTEPGWFNWTWGFYFGGKVFDEERGIITADDPKNVEALLWTKRYAEKYGREKLLQFRSGFGNFDSPQNAFIDGHVSMEVQGVWFSNFIRRHNPHMEFGVAPAPAAPGMPIPMSLVDCDVIAIPRGCRNVEAAISRLHGDSLTSASARAWLFSVDCRASTCPSKSRRRTFTLDIRIWKSASSSNSQRRRTLSSSRASVSGANTSMSWKKSLNTSGTGRCQRTNSPVSPAMRDKKKWMTSAVSKLNKPSATCARECSGSMIICWKGTKCD